MRTFDKSTKLSKKKKHVYNTSYKIIVFPLYLFKFQPLASWYIKRLILFLAVSFTAELLEKSYFYFVNQRRAGEAGSVRSGWLPLPICYHIGLLQAVGKGIVEVGI